MDLGNDTAKKHERDFLSILEGENLLAAQQALYILNIISLTRVPWEHAFSKL